MAIITLNKASLSFGHHVLLDKISIGIEKGDKIGLIGRNGSGKSSLLKILANKIELDDGNLYIADGIKIAYIAQEPELNMANTIFTEVSSALVQANTLLIKYHQVLDKLENNYTEILLEELQQVQNEMEHNDTWQAKNLIDKVLSELNLNGNRLISSLSGGVKKKIAIAKLLVLKPDVILLDEPTNHLDINVIKWLEEVINNFNGSVVLITHDRAFLDKTVNKIIELDRGVLRQYIASYAKYREIKAEQLLVETKQNQEFDKLLSQEEVWIRKGIEARRTRNEGRVRKLYELREERLKRRNDISHINFKVDSSIISGKIVAKVEDINVSFDNKSIVTDFSVNITRGDKIGLIGPNGIGKSTLLKVLLGKLKPNSGKVKLGTKLEVAYFDQFREQLDDNATIQDVVSQGQDYVEINGRKLHIATYLENFLFEAKRFRSPVKSLSGGEKNRLLLARLFSRPANILVLDEPTNDLDIETLELLEEFLVEYTGTILIVSHDRQFLDNVVTNSLVFLGNSKILDFHGGYTDYISYEAQHTLAPQIQPKVAKVKTIKAPQSKLNYKEKAELARLPQEIEELEREQTRLNQEILNPEIYKYENTNIIEIHKKINELETAIAAKLIRWEDLENRL